MPNEKISHSTPEAGDQTPGIDSSMFQIPEEPLKPLPSWEEFQAQRRAETANAEAARQEAAERRAERCQRQAEKLQQTEYFQEKVRPVINKAAATLLAVAALIGGGAVMHNLNQETIDNRNAKEQSYFENKDDSVDAITIVKAANVREQPVVPDSDDIDNYLATTEGGVTIDVDYAIIANPDNSGNGQWIGIPAENAVEGAIISESQAEQDDNGVVWLNNNSANDTKIILHHSEETASDAASAANSEESHE